MDDSDSNQMKLTDVNDDCLEEIFRNLSVQDLLAIADTHARFKSAAEHAFFRKFERKVIVNIFTTSHNLCVPIKHSARLDSGGYIRVSSLKDILRLLRCFGHLITELQFRNEPKYSSKILEYANEYCSNSLLTFKWHKCMSDFKAPFTNVEHVEFVNCQFPKAVRLNEMFPAMRSLTLNNIFDKLFLALNGVHFSHLEHLKIENTEAIDILRLNPQLKSLSFDTNNQPLRLWPKYDVSHFKQLKKLDIFCHSLTNIPYQFNQLEDMKLCLNFKENEMGIKIQKIITFFAQHSTITKLILHGQQSKSA